MNKPKCPYCGAMSEIVRGDVIYPHRPDLAALCFHRCSPCDAYVGSHKAGAFVYVGGKRVESDGTLPLGRLANAELRAAKRAAHDAFDPIWRETKVTRRGAYLWLSQALGLHLEATHIGEFDVSQCKAVVAACATRKHK